MADGAAQQVALLGTAQSVAEEILSWARDNGALASDRTLLLTRRNAAAEVFPQVQGKDAEEIGRAEKTLQRVKIVAVAVDEASKRATVLTKSQLSAAAEKLLPEEINGVRLTYIGHAGIEPNPPTIPQTVAGAAPRSFLHNNRLACGSSLTAAPIHQAGTLGALVSLADGTICGLTNNHVTGGCNHTVLDMHILCPSPLDADPTQPAPTAIGRHHSFVPLASGDPGQVRLQELDVALFRLTLPDAVTSMQGAGFYDTPVNTVMPVGGMKVKKVGRTTGLTNGVVVGTLATPLPIPYESDRFRSTVYFQNVWMVQTTTGDPFSLGGDSGSLVVTDDGQAAVGLVFAGTNAGEASFMIPIDTVLGTFGATLIGGHGT